MKITILSVLILLFNALYSQAQFVTGTYTGNGSTQSISGLSFQPDIVIIKHGGSSTTATSQVRIAGMGSTTGDWGGTGIQFNGTDRITSLDASGFSVGTSSTVNSNGETYHYFALKSKANEVAVGSYTGNGVDNRDINALTFQPDFVMICCPTQFTAFRTSTMTGDNTSGLALALTANLIQAFNSTGFQVGTDSRVNANGTTYYYLACKSVAGSFRVGTYVGNATDNRSITGFGFQPGFIVAKNVNTTTAGFKTMSTGPTTDLTLVPNATPTVTDCIQQLLPDGIELGAANRCNGNGITFHYFAFGETGPSTWNGTTWSPSTPGATTDAIIASNTTPGSFTCKALTINNGVALTINSGAAATINGNLTNNGNGIGGTGTVTFASSSTISGNAISFAGTITVSTGAILTTAGLITLSSDALNTGRIGNSAGSISGNVTAQRYIPGKRAFRFLGHPFTSSQPLTTLTDDIDITGSGGAANGFTATSTNNPSAYWFDVSTADNSTSGTNTGWKPFTHTNGASPNGWDQYELLRLLVRGSIGQGLNGGNYTPSSVTLDMTGTVNQGTQTVTLTKGSSSNFVSCGNPFPCGVQMNAVAKGSNIGANYYVWDATSGMAGAYVTNAFTLSYILPSFGALVTTATANANNTLTFEESDKDAGGAALFKGSGNNPNWIELTIHDSTIKWDRLLVNFDNNAMSVQDNLDAVKLYNPGLDFFTLSKDDVRLAVDVRPIENNTSIPLGLTVYNRYNRYVIRTGMYDVPKGTTLYLYDYYLNKTEQLKDGFEYWFDVNTDSTSQGNKRFEIRAVITPAMVISETSNQAPGMELIPNPACNNVKISYKNIEGMADVRLISVTGKVVYQGKAGDSTGSVVIPLQQLPAGIYVAELCSKNARLTQKLIKE